MTSRFAVIARFPGYRIGRDGSLWTSKERLYTPGRKGVTWVNGRKWKRMTPAVVNGYLQTCLTDVHGRGRQMKIHLLVLEAFVGPRPPGLQGRHLDDNRLNNKRSNLAWGSQFENADDARRNGRVCKGDTHPGSVLTSSVVTEIMRLNGEGKTSGQIAAELSMYRQIVSNVINGWTWNHVTGLPKRS